MTIDRFCLPLASEDFNLQLRALLYNIIITVQVAKYHSNVMYTVQVAIYTTNLKI